MSAIWKLRQARFMLDRSREFKDRFLVHSDNLPFPHAYEFYVDATIHALYGARDFLRSEFAHKVAEDGLPFKDWYSSTVGAAEKQEAGVLRFLFRKGKGIRQITTHQEPLVLSSEGRRTRGETYSVVDQDGAPLPVRDPDGSFPHSAHVDWHFQDLQMEVFREGAPKWKTDLAATSVDEILEQALSEMTEYVTQAYELYDDARTDVPIRDVIRNVLQEG